MHQNKEIKTSKPASIFVQKCSVHNSKFHFILPFLLIAGISSSFGQVLSVKSGDWDDPTVWSGGLVPNSSSGTITVRHTVHVRSSVYSSSNPLLIDQTTV